ncbi:hypothetical protein [Guptibacillus spartinae]|uniref:hypothetical protein n=1 Tax=Guptibacillus spartinae TaxID=3025679 RepID=UPI00235E24F6|nr:hypothetical protein [Pseudalkalibacillus spartinae]
MTSSLIAGDKMKSVWKKSRLAFYLLSTIYVLLRLVMLFSSIDNHTVYFYKEPLAPSFFYWDLLFLIIWSVRILRLPKQRLFKFFLFIGIMLTLAFYGALTIVNSVSTGGEVKAIQTDQMSDDYLIRLGNLPGIHPGNDSHRDLFVYKKNFPMVYTKIYETNLSFTWDEVEAYRKGEARLRMRDGNKVLVLANKEIMILKGE